MFAAVSVCSRSVCTVRSVATLANRREFAITAVTCADDHKRWSGVETHDDYRVVLVRRGRFRRRADGVVTDVDRTQGYLGMPGQEENFAHPHGGDTCTAVHLPTESWPILGGDAVPPRTTCVYVDARLELAHRRFLAVATDRDVDYAVAEELIRLLAATLGRAAIESPPVTALVPGTDRALVSAAREAIGSDHPASNTLLSLAGLLDVSPYQLSRAFSRELGVSLTRYRNRVRVGRVLDRLEAGQDSLSPLAAELRFADQAHLCRTVREHLGCTPTALRRLLRG